MNIPSPYRYKTGYIYLPLDPNIKGLHETLQVFGKEYHLKSSFHVSLVCVKDILSQYKDIDEHKLLEALSDFINQYPLGEVQYGSEYRIATHMDGRGSIIQKVYIKGITELFEYIRSKFHVKLDTQPTHVTIYTLQKDMGIGINTEKSYRETFELRFKS